MTGYILRRLLALAPTLIIVAVITFGLVHITPGDPAAFILGPDATTDAVEILRTRLGLDRPLALQFTDWVTSLMRADLGESLYTNQSVLQTIASRLEPTVALMVMAVVVAIVLGIPMGIIAALNRNSFLDQVLLVVSLLGVSMPNFWLGINLILLFSVQFAILPVAGYVPLQVDPMATVAHLLLPAMALGFSQAAIVARITRTSMLEVLSLDYVRTARAKGLPSQFVVVKHALRNALVPIVTILGTVVAVLLGGSMVIEVVFNLPGLGRLMINSVQRRDYPVIQGVVLFVTLTNVLVMLLIDVLYAAIDPRIEYA